MEAPAKAEKPAKFEVIRSNHDFGVRGENFDVMFSDLNGGLVSYRYGGVEMIKMIPKPNFWRAPIDNDCKSLMPMRYSQWKIGFRCICPTNIRTAAIIRDCMRRKSKYTRTAQKSATAM